MIVSMKISMREKRYHRDVGGKGIEIRWVVILAIETPELFGLCANP